jgi:hypothetical protein
MITMWRPHAMSIHPLIFLALLVAVPGHVFAQGGSVEMPENARAKSYGGGWECDRGYREDNGACAAIKVPANAYLNSSGDRWTCDRAHLIAVSTYKVDDSPASFPAKPPAACCLAFGTSS